MVHFKTVGMRISTITKLKFFQPFAFIYCVLLIIVTITSWKRQTCTHFCYVHNNLNFLFDTWIAFAWSLLNNWRFSNIDVMPPFSHDNGVEQVRKAFNFSMFFSHLSQQPNHAPLKQKPIFFGPLFFCQTRPRSFFILHNFISSFNNKTLVHNEIVLSSIMLKLTLQFNKEFGAHCFSIITTTGLTHGSRCNSFISHRNKSPNNLVINVFNIFSTILQLR